jgi:hypothetical protein
VRPTCQGTRGLPASAVLVNACSFLILARLA